MVTTSRCRARIWWLWFTLSTRRSLHRFFRWTWSMRPCALAPVRLLLEVVARKQRELCALLVVCSAFVLTAACLMFFIEHPYQPSTFSSVPAAAWWAIETVTSLGYGDMVPASTIGKIFSSFVSVCAVFLFAVPAGVVTSGFIEHELEARDHRKTVNLTQTAADNAGYRYGTFSQSVANDGRGEFDATVTAPHQLPTAK